MAETLLGATRADEANDHLEAARLHLNRVDDTGAARVSYNYALANLHAFADEGDTALTTLEHCVVEAKACRFSRGHLMALARIFTICIQERRHLRATRTLFRAVPLLFDGELRRNSLLAIAARFRRYALHVFRPYGVGASTADRPGGVACPCPIHPERRAAPTTAD